MKFIKFVAPTAVLGILAFGLGTMPASATTVTTTFGVSATVQATCLVSATAMDFGTYTGAAASGSTTVSVTCTNTTGYNVSLSAGSGGSVTTRQMVGPNSAVLNYGLFRDSAYKNNWGVTVGTDTVAGTGDGSAQTINVYGQVPAGQYVAPGTYSDTITATVTY